MILEKKKEHKLPFPLVKIHLHIVYVLAISMIKVGYKIYVLVESWSAKIIILGLCYLLLIQN